MREKEEDKEGRYLLDDFILDQIRTRKNANLIADLQDLYANMTLVRLRGLYTGSYLHRYIIRAILGKDSVAIIERFVEREGK